MKLKKEEVEKIANLARISLSPEEKKKFQGELSSILEFVGQLNEVNTEGVEPTYQVTGLGNVFREDEVFSCDSKIKEEITGNFPDSKDSLLKVPAIFNKKKE